MNNKGSTISNPYLFFAIIIVTATITSAIPVTSLVVNDSSKMVTAIATAVTGSRAPRMATGVLPMREIAALVQMSEKAVGKNAMPATLSHSMGCSLSISKHDMLAKGMKRKTPKLMT